MGIAAALFFSRVTLDSASVCTSSGMALSAVASCCRKILISINFREVTPSFSNRWHVLIQHHLSFPGLRPNATLRDCVSSFDALDILHAARYASLSSCGAQSFLVEISTSVTIWTPPNSCCCWLHPLCIFASPLSRYPWHRRSAIHAGRI